MYIGLGLLSGFVLMCVGIAVAVLAVVFAATGWLPGGSWWYDDQEGEEKSETNGQE